jgi:hypothetical protein
MGKPIQKITVTGVVIPDGGLTSTEALAKNSERVHLMHKYEGSLYYVAYDNDLITGADAAAVKAQMRKIDADYTGDFWDTGGMPVCRVSFYQDIGGGNITQKIEEGI